MNDLIVKEDIKIENLIYEIRGKQVMLDSDIANIYGVETKRINEAVRNNIDKFPERYSWKLTDTESNILLVENFDQKIEKRGGKYKNPRVFTEQGIYMLATILKSKIATEVTIVIMDAFVMMKRYIKVNNNQNNRISNIETKVLEHDNKINLILDKLNSKEEVNHIFYDGEIYDAYSLLIDILSSSKEEIINTNIFHDRFILIDKKTLYHSGASFKDLGKKCFAITKIEDINIINNLLDRLEELYE